MNPKISLDQPGTYRIRVQGQLDERWLDYFEGMTIDVTQAADGLPVSTLSGCLQDQAAVHGMLQKLYSLGFPLLSVEQVEGN
jgi:hypothetical protein